MSEITKRISNRILSLTNQVTNNIMASSEDYSLFKKLSDNYQKYMATKVKNQNEVQITVGKLWNDINLK